MPGDPFQIERPVLSWLLRLGTCRAVYRAAQQVSAEAFETRILQVLGIQTECDSSDLGLIPKAGPLVIAANHPHGAVDGLVLLATLRRIRPDVRVLANHLLSRIPELADLCFFVDPFDGPSAAARSRAGLRAAHLWLKRGGSLAVFPAGEVAHTLRPDGAYGDSPWRSTVGRLAISTGAAVVPVFIEGRNSRWFYAAGRVHPKLRTALLARELLNTRGSRVRVRFGRALSSMELAARGSTAEDITRTARSAAERLRTSLIVDPTPTSQIETEIDTLPNEAHLIDDGAFQVFCARPSAIPAALREIGRLREVTYRAAGEGTGRAIDLDPFDERYLHLFAWDRRQRVIVGAYRIGETDRIVAEQGIEGLYTRTLFRYDERLLNRLSPALELGRSFVRPDYQRNYSALLSLWKGIGRFVVQNPQYRVLFGPVSISIRYSDSSHHLLMQFLSQNHRDDELAELVEATNPAHMMEPPAHAGPVPRSIDEINRLVAGGEQDGKGVPVLLRQYLKLNARLIGFNVDPDFGDTLDALMMVDLTRVDANILNRYLGRDGSASILARHRSPSSSRAA